MNQDRGNLQEVESLSLAGSRASNDDSLHSARVQDADLSGEDHHNADLVGRTTLPSRSGGPIPSTFTRYR